MTYLIILHAFYHYPLVIKHSHGKIHNFLLEKLITCMANFQPENC